MQDNNEQKDSHVKITRDLSGTKTEFCKDLYVPKRSTHLEVKSVSIGVKIDFTQQPSVNENVVTVSVKESKKPPTTFKFPNPPMTKHDKDLLATAQAFRESIDHNYDDHEHVAEFTDFLKKGLELKGGEGKPSKPLTLELQKYLKEYMSDIQKLIGLGEIKVRTPQPPM